MEDMYGRANPKPEPPKFDAEDMKNMREAEETRLLKARETSKNELYWQEIEVEKCLGLETETIKWKQNQTYVEIFVRLDGYAGGMSAHESAKSEDVQVDMSRSRLSVRYKDDVIIDDKKLYKDIKVELSTWVIVDNVLEICLLKFCRRGAGYAGGKSNADTFWRSLFSDEYLNALRVEDSKVHLDSTSSLTEDDVKKSIPERYYETEFDENYGVRVGNKARHSSNRPMVARTKTDVDYFIAGVNAILSAAFSVSKILLLHAKITKVRQHLISVSVLCNVLISLCSFLQSFSSSPLARLRLTYANFQCVSTCNPIALLPVLTRPV